MGRGHLARAAPRCPKVNEDGNLAFANDLIEFFGADLNGLSDRW
jgi:hypothetical protein